MRASPEHEDLEAALRRCGAGWDAAQAHGLLCGRLAVAGRSAGRDWLNEVTRDFTPGDANRDECEVLLDALLDASIAELAERQSGFQPLLPDDAAPAEERAHALAHWCEGFLHGLVSGPHAESLKARLASDPVSGVIKDMLEITRATAGDENEETVEEAYTELVEYVRTAAQLVYEELAPWRAAAGQSGDGAADRLH